MSNETPSTDPDTPSLNPETPDDLITKAFAEAVARFADSALRGTPTEADRAALKRAGGSDRAARQKPNMPPIERDTDEWREMARDFRGKPLPVDTNFLARPGKSMSVGRNSY